MEMGPLARADVRFIYRETRASSRNSPGIILIRRGEPLALLNSVDVLLQRYFIIVRLFLQYVYKNYNILCK